MKTRVEDLNSGTREGRGYFCICEQEGNPVGAFGSLEQAIRYRVEQEIEGVVRYFDLATQKYHEERWL